MILQHLDYRIKLFLRLLPGKTPPPATPPPTSPAAKPSRTIASPILRQMPSKAFSKIRIAWFSPINFCLRQLKTEPLLPP